MPAIPPSHAILGQGAGDALGVLLSLLPYTKYLQCLQRQSLPIIGKDYSCAAEHAFLPGMYTSQTQVSLAMYRCWEDLENPQDCKVFEQQLRYHWQSLHPANAPTLFRGFVPTIKPIYSDEPAPRRQDILPALWLGPISTRHDRLQSMLPWVAYLSQLFSSHPISITASIYYSSLCWALAHQQSPETILKELQLWRQGSVAKALPISDKLWWTFEQAIWICQRYHTQPMLEFLSQTLDTPLSQVSPEHALSLLPVIFQRGTQLEDFNAILHPSEKPTSHHEVTMLGCVLGLRGILPPKWLFGQLAGSHLLEHPLHWSAHAEQEMAQQQEAFRKKITVTVKPTKRRKRPKASNSSIYKQLSLFNDD